MNHKTELSTKILATIGELAVIASLFPYQITVNRKEKSMSARSLLLYVKSEKKEDETGKISRNVTFNMPGFAFRDAAKAIESRISQKTSEKKFVLRRKRKKASRDNEE